MRRRLYWTLLSAGLMQCAPNAFDASRFASLTFHLADGSSAKWEQLRSTKATVLITLDPECPFCQGYSPVIDSLARAYVEEGVRFIGLYPTSFIAPDSALRFARENLFDFPQVMDTDCAVANALRARVTPECFVLDANGDLFYRGAIDNWAVRAGKHRVTATEHYLRDAIDAVVGGKGRSRDEVTAVGCIVECGEATSQR